MKKQIDCRTNTDFVIVTCFNVFETRVKYVVNSLNEKGWSYCILASDFSHRDKKYYSIENQRCTYQLHVPKYKKNMSFKRLFSHNAFAKKVYKALLSIRPNAIYIVAPPNSLFKYIKKYVNKYPNTRIIFDIFDVWPETLPLGCKTKKLLAVPLMMWRRRRDNYLCKNFEYVFECNLFNDYFKRRYGLLNCQTIYLGRKKYSDYIIGVSNTNPLNFVYLGSINNIIDIDLIILFLSELKKYKPVFLKIIGAGEKESILKEKCFEQKIPYEFYGPVFDEEKKAKILSDCHFGLNVFKESVFVGLTMKSIEYFHWGLAFINTIKGDTFKIVESNQCGYNINYDNFKSAAKACSLLDVDSINKMKNNSFCVYESLFDASIIQKKFDILIVNIE